LSVKTNFASSLHSSIIISLNFYLLLIVVVVVVVVVVTITIVFLNFFATFLSFHSEPELVVCNLINRWQG
jgi:hypothetical protein